MDKLLYDKLQHYCEYQERCERDVLQKCRTLKIEREEIGAYVDKLREENFLNEKRYIKGFIYSKHTYKKWGGQKIKAALSAKGIKAAAAKEFLQEILPEEILENALLSGQRKWKSIKGDTLQARKIKLMRFLIGRGFDMSVVKKVTDDTCRK